MNTLALILSDNSLVDVLVLVLIVVVIVLLIKKL